MKKKLCPLCCSEMTPECDPPYTYLVCLYCGYPHAEDTDTDTKETDGYKKVIEWDESKGIYEFPSLYHCPEIGEMIPDNSGDIFEVVGIKKVGDVPILTLAYRGLAE